MVRLNLVFVCLLISTALHSQTPQHPITHVEACGKFSSAVVEVDTDHEKGTGFIVSPDGWVLTAGHVAIDQRKGRNYNAITVKLWDGSTLPAIQALPITNDIILRDLAVLKIIQPKSALPYLELGDENDAKIGSDITIIGYPFSANGPPFGEPIESKFCLVLSLLKHIFKLGKPILMWFTSKAYL